MAQYRSHDDDETPGYLQKYLEIVTQDLSSSDPEKPIQQMARNGKT